MRFNRFVLSLAAVAGIGLASSAQAAILFSYGAVTSLGGNSYSVPLLVRSDTTSLSVVGANLTQVIGDGGVFAGGTTAAPSFVSVNLKPTGGLFAPATETPNTSTNQPQINIQSITLLGSGAVASVTIPTTSTLLATVSFNTTGLVGKTFNLTNNFGGSPSKFTAASTGAALNVTNLTAPITIPEPATLAAVGLAGVALVRRRRSIAV